MLAHILDLDLPQQNRPIPRKVTTSLCTSSWECITYYLRYRLNTRSRLSADELGWTNVPPARNPPDLEYIAAEDMARVRKDCTVYLINLVMSNTVGKANRYTMLAEVVAFLRLELKQRLRSMSRYWGASIDKAVGHSHYMLHPCIG